MVLNLLLSLAQSIYTITMSIINTLLLMVHVLPQLPYAADALAPKMSKETIEYHYGKHHQAYVNNLNNLIPGTPYENMPLEEIIVKAESGPIYNNAAQVWNHTFFFFTLSPTPKSMPSGKLAEAINRDFGSFDAFKEQFTKAAAGLFGSGWTWLAADDNGKLSIVSESNAGNPLAQGAASAADRRRVGTRLLHRLPQRAARLSEKFLGTGRLEHRRKTIRKINPPRAGHSPKRPDAMSHPAFLFDLPPGVSPDAASGCTFPEIRPGNPAAKFLLSDPAHRCLRGSEIPASRIPG